MQPNGKFPSSEEERRHFVATFQWKMSIGGKDGMADLDFHPATNAVLGLQGFFGLVIDDVWKVRPDPNVQLFSLAMSACFQA